MTNDLLYQGRRWGRRCLVHQGGWPLEAVSSLQSDFPPLPTRGGYCRKNCSFCTIHGLSATSLTLHYLLCTLHKAKLPITHHLRLGLPLLIPRLSGVPSPLHSTSAIWKTTPMCTSPNYCCLKSSHYVLHPTSHFIQKLPTCPPHWAHGAQTGGKLFWMRTRFGKLIWMRLTCRLLGGQAKFKRHMKNEIKIWSYIALDTFLSIG